MPTDQIFISLSQEIVCPIDPSHRFPLKDGLGQATIQALQKQSLDASEQLRRSLESEIQAQIQAKVQAKHSRDLSEIQQQLESEKQRREKERLAAAEALEKLRIEAKATAEQDNKRLKEDLEKLSAENREIKKLQADLEREKARLANREEELKLENAKQLNLEREKIKEATRAAEAERFRLREEELTQSKQATEALLRELREALSAKNAAELKLRREMDDLLAAKETAIAQAVNTARNEMRETLAAQEAEKAKIALAKEKEEWSLQRAHLEKQLQDARNSAEDLKRKMEQGSQQTQGEALELTIEAGLRARFPMDTVVEVGKGERGADIIQTVIAPGGRVCGKIIWEAKNTKSWGTKWLEKLREDQLSSKSDLAVLVSVALPEGVTTFDLVDGVWVCSLSSWLALAVALRTQLIALDGARSSSVNREQKMELLYNYLAGNEFRIRVENMVNTFNAMHEQLQQERRALNKHWNTRAKQIDTVIDNISGMYGDLQGIMGAQSLPDVSSLALEGTEEE